ncbi:hypothetical protein L1987_01631 [Smallanthus sonchifolius]|uniref:Uncharacterized protein n=1 Tax=Smallanthus sonchifolius TaxID=185202 RepID=A0ACB9K5R2_9ASTR|nr:hypothetical protein L1987_01631 [Smallanthus sonchifolius]
MTKKMKLDSFKHQTLVQDYTELQQETEAARNNLMALKQKKLTLQAEVRFLRQRHRYLEEEEQEQREPLDPVIQGLIRNGVDEQHTDAQLSIFRNVGKRKVSWKILWL